MAAGALGVAVLSLVPGFSWGLGFRVQTPLNPISKSTLKSLIGGNPIRKPYVTPISPFC